MSKSLVFNKIPLKKIEIGMSVSYSQTVTDSDIKKFAEISGDRNPVHLDEVFAENSRYKKRIAHGLLTASYFSALFGTKIPGERLRLRFSITQVQKTCLSWGYCHCNSRSNKSRFKKKKSFFQNYM